MRSSLGFHTMMLFMNIEKKDVSRLIKDFKRYNEQTGLIKIYYVDICDDVEYAVGETIEAASVKRYNVKISYYKEDRGIEWLIRRCNWSNDFKAFTVEVKINPKLLGGVNDYITAASFDDMETAIENFNNECRKISRVLLSFDYYKLKRIDYCINLYLPELVPGCSPEQIMTLIRRSNIPTHYKEWTEYDEISHRRKSKPSSFYLINNSVNINCYSKLMELQERSDERLKKGLSPVPQATFDAAKGIIRFEVQCKYLKTYILSNKAAESGDRSKNKYRSLLSHIACFNAVSYYYKKNIGRSDWYSLSEAVKIIESCGFYKQKEARLINALQTVNQCRGIPKAKEMFTGNELIGFSKTLIELSNMGINPVTIPKEWGIKHIPNLFRTYYNAVNDSDFRQEVRDFNRNCFSEFSFATDIMKGARIQNEDYLL